MALPLFGWIVLFTMLGGIASAAFAGLFLLLPEQTGLRLLPHFVSFATGALLGAALLALLPEAMERVGSDGAHAIGASLVLGLALFFVIEKLVLWKHGHSHESDDPPHDSEGTPTPGHGDRGHAPLRHDHGHERRNHGHGHDRSAGVLVLIGDSIHNALDGVLIAAAFLSNVPLGVVATVAVAAHEVPHRVGDFAILLQAGFTRRRALFLNMATGVTSVIGGIAAYFGLQKAMGVLPYALAFAAAGFLYIALAGLIPGLHRRADPRTSLLQVLWMGIGAGVVAWAEALAHSV